MTVLRTLLALVGLGGVTSPKPAPAGGPYEDEARTLARVQAQMERDPGEFIEKSDMLSSEEFALIGKVIQSYCSADLNARRTINAIRKAAYGPDQQNGGKLQDKQVYEKLLEAIELLPEGNVKDGLRSAATTIAMHHMRRHDFAHWVFRKVPGEEIFVFFTNDERESANRTGNPIGPGYSRYGLMPKGPMIAEAEKLYGHSGYLAQQAVHLEEGHDELKAYFDQRKEAERKAKFEASKAKSALKGQRRASAEKAGQ